MTQESQERYLEISRREIESVALLMDTLETQLKSEEQKLQNLVQAYQRQRYQRQEEAWRSRCLTRCTNCYGVSPTSTMKLPTAWGGWGLIPFDDVHYVAISGDHWHTSHESDHHDTHLWFHRLCSHCYTDKLKSCAAGSETMRDLDQEDVRQINGVIENDQESGVHDRVLRKLYGWVTDIKVYWHELPIPEGAYEIGVKLDLKHDSSWHYHLKK